MLAALDYMSAAFALLLAGFIAADRAGWATLAQTAVRGLTVLSLAYLAMLAVLPGVRP